MGEAHTFRGGGVRQDSAMCFSFQTSIAARQQPARSHFLAVCLCVIAKQKCQFLKHQCLFCNFSACSLRCVISCGLDNRNVVHRRTLRYWSQNCYLQIVYKERMRNDLLLSTQFIWSSRQTCLFFLVNNCNQLNSSVFHNVLQNSVLSVFAHN